jgi:NodT family efflux transporter outer membrane factor (OMF) lipoprotein
MKYSGWIVSVGLVFGGCSLNEQALQPREVLPLAYTAQAEEVRAQISPAWWKAFNIAALDELVEEALAQNYDILIAQERLRQARTQIRIAEANMLPSASFSANTSASESKRSGESWSSGESSRLSLGVSYELDLWGRLEAQTRMAKSAYTASAYDLEASRLSLSASVVSYYLQLCALERRVALAEENLAIAEKLLYIVERKEREGLATLMDTNRQKATLLQNRSSLLSLQNQAKQTANALALILGKPVQELDVSVVSFDAIAPLEVGAGLPSELLTRRPDIAAAMMRLQNVQDAIHVAHTARFPSFSLTGSAGLASVALLSLSNPLTTTLSGALGLSYTLFDGGKLDEALEAARSKGDETVLDVEKTILTALKEVEDALLERALSAKQLGLQEEILRLEKVTLAQSTLRYQEGVSDYATLLDAQRSFYQAQDQRATQLLSLLNATVTLHKVLGGGWAQ